MKWFWVWKPEWPSRIQERHTEEEVVELRRAGYYCMEVE